MKKIDFLITSLIIVVFVFCDSKDPTGNNSQLILTDTTAYLTKLSSSGKIEVELFLIDSVLKTGYDSLKFKFIDPVNGQTLNDISAFLFPIMINGTTIYSAPVDSSENKPRTDSLLHTAVLFQSLIDSTTTKSRNWILRLKIIDKRYSGNVNDSVEFPVTVKSASGSFPVFSDLPVKAGKISAEPILWYGKDSVERMVALVQPLNPSEGSNVLELFVAKKNSELAWVSDSECFFSFVPTMPTMGSHSSPGNTNPMHVTKGHYIGKVNFTMSGLWRLIFKVSCYGNSQVVDSTHYIDVFF